MDIEKYAVRHPKSRGANLAPEILDLISQMEEGSKILDIGCAEGFTIKDLYKLFGGKYSYCGVDLSGTRISKARSHKIPGAEFIRASGEEIPLPNGEFDCILCSQVLEHVENEDALLKEIYRLLKPGGIFEVDTVYKEKWAWYFYKAPIGWALDPTHLREYTELSEVEELFRRNKLPVKDLIKTKSYRNINQMIPLNIKIRIPGYYNLFIIGEK